MTREFRHGSDQTPRAPRTSISGDEIRTHLERLCSIGNRYVGSLGEAQARDYVLERFEEAELQRVRAEELTVRTYRPALCDCILSEDDLRLDCAGLQGTVTGTVEAEAVFLGRAISSDDLPMIQDSKLEGKIAVVQSYWPWELTKHLLASGVAGIVLISEVPENRIAHLPADWYGAVDSPLVPVPGVVVGAHPVCSSSPRSLAVRGV